MAPPAAKLGMELNNIGFYNPQNQLISTCVGLYQIGMNMYLEDIQNFNISFQIISAEPVLIKLFAYSEFNLAKKLTTSLEEPDCSGRFESNTSIYTDIVSAGDKAYELAFELTTNSLGIFELKSAAALYEGPVIKDQIYGVFPKYIDSKSLRIFARKERTSPVQPTSTNPI